MNALLLPTILTLSITGIIAAIVLFVAAKKFRVEEDPKIDEVEQALPGANCGGCGLAGCRNFAEIVVQSRDLEKWACPVGGAACMSRVAAILGLEVGTLLRPRAAVLHCNGSCTNAPTRIHYQGIASCQLAHTQFAGESGCPAGCLRHGDCVLSCRFDAIEMDAVTGLPTVNETKCTACGACVRACPRALLQLWPKGTKVYVACKNREKGAVAKKQCSVACIGCGKCARVVSEDEQMRDKVKVENNLSTIHLDVDCEKYGHALQECCPTHAIVYREEKPHAN